MPTFYIILGIPKSGRREVIFDLIDGGIPENSSTAVYLSANEQDSPFDEQLAAQPNTQVIRWSADESGADAPAPPVETEHIFFLTEGKSNPIDQLEFLQAWSKAHGLTVTRVLTIVHCQIAEKEDELLPWFEACIHFSDCVLLNRREGVANKWITEFEKNFKSNHFPCLFELVKKGRVSNPPLLLTDEPRRISHLFDQLDALDAIDDLEEDDIPEEGLDLIAPVDPYLKRHPSGPREIQIPDLSDFLKKHS